MRSEALWILINLCTGGEVENIRALVTAQPVNVITALCGALEGHHLEVHLAALEGLRCVSVWYKPAAGDPGVDDMIDACYGLDLLRGQVSNENAKVSEMAECLLDYLVAMCD